MPTLTPPTATPTRERPTFLGLLNAIAVSEGHGHDFLIEWADRTADARVEEVLRTVAAREAEHAASFARRVVELGFRVRPREMSPEEQRRLEIASSTMSDQDKFRALGYDAAPDPSDIFDAYFADHSIDPVTGALLGRFVCEERDSDRLLRDACAGLAEDGSGA